MIETQRLILRELTAADAAGMFRLDSDPLVHAYLGNNPIGSLEQAEDVIAFVQKQYTENGIGRWAVIEKETGEFMGWSGLKLITEAFLGMPHYYDLGYRLIPAFWGKGYATEAGKAWVNEAFQHRNIPQLFASTHIENHASAAVLIKCGFTEQNQVLYEGEPQRWFELKNSEV